MTVNKRKSKPSSVEALTADRDLMKALVTEALQGILEAEMTEQIGAAPGERSDVRLGYRAGYYKCGDKSAHDGLRARCLLQNVGTSQQLPTKRNMRGQPQSIGRYRAKTNDGMTGDARERVDYLIDRRRHRPLPAVFYGDTKAARDTHQLSMLVKLASTRSAWSR